MEQVEEIYKEYNRLKKGGGVSEYMRLLDRCIKALKQYDEEIMAKIAEIDSRLTRLERQTDLTQYVQELKETLRGDR